jgi:transposase InsO family protein
MGNGEASEDGDRRRRPEDGRTHKEASSRTDPSFQPGSHDTSLDFSERLKEIGITPSMGRTDRALDNAIAESFISALKTGLVSNLTFPARRAAKSAIFEYL